MDSVFALMERANIGKSVVRCGCQPKQLAEPQNSAVRSQQCDVVANQSNLQKHQLTMSHLQFVVFGNDSDRRVCRCGAGKEMTAGKCDTPGFAMSDEPEIRLDKKRSTKLYMPRNNTRLNQTSTTLLQGWRGNCDIQILVYRCDPRKPDSSEIARVTDYVASYSCKGNYSLKEER